MVVFEKLGIKANNCACSVAHISTLIEKENKITWVWKWMDSKWDNKLTSLQKNHNFLSIYLIDLKFSKNIASWSDAPYSIYKTQNQIKTKKLCYFEIKGLKLNKHG
jgi:hypothetical protein